MVTTRQRDPLVASGHGSDVALIRIAKILLEIRSMSRFDRHALAQKGTRMSCSQFWLPAFLLVSACGGTVSSRQEHTTGGDSPGDAGVGGGGAGSAGAPHGGSAGHVTREPTQHRAEATACGIPPPDTGAAGASSQGQGAPLQPCTQNSQCTSAPNGRCTFSNRYGHYCSYDACFADTDCVAGAVCTCSGPDGTGNRCSAPGCQVDADCPGSWCSPTFGSCGAYFGVESYACHGAADECINDSDCSDGSPVAAYCMYDPLVTHWICSSAQCVG